MRYRACIFCLALVFMAGGFSLLSCRAEKAGTLGTQESGFSAAEPEDIAGGYSAGSAMLINVEEKPDFILLSYRDPAMSNWVTAFFRDLCGSHEIAVLILSNAAEFGVSPALAFSLCWEESRYNPRALNRNRNGTVDRGLFQLNNASFPNLKVEDFYDPAINVRYGMAHLRWCLDDAGTEVAALAMYNAGHNRVRSAGTPKSTLDYVSRILRRQRRIEELFIAEYMRITEAESAEAEEKEKSFFRFSLLTPLGRR